MPSLREKHDEFMLRELVKRWTNHKVMVRWLSRFFHYLDRYFIARRSLPALNEVGLTCFRDLVRTLVSKISVCNTFLMTWSIWHNHFQSIKLFYRLVVLCLMCKIVLFSDNLITCVHFQVYNEINGKVRDAVISLVWDLSAFNRKSIFWCIDFIDLFSPFICS